MALICYPVQRKEKSKLLCHAFAKGAPASAVGTVFYGTEGVMDQFVAARASGKPWWYIDNSYFDTHRGLYFRVTKNALQVDPTGKTSDGARFKRLGIAIQPWRTELGPDTLLCPQSDDFMKSTLGLRGYNWAADVQARIAAFGLPQYPVRVRPWNRDKKHQAVVLDAELPRCRLVISHSSSASITAMIAGVPSISTGRTAAHWRLSGELTPATFEHPPRPSDAERRMFCSVLADNQFTLDEFRDGTAWRWLEGR